VFPLSSEASERRISLGRKAYLATSTAKDAIKLEHSINQEMMSQSISGCVSDSTLVQVPLAAAKKIRS
jgi:hypothetical protein